MVSITIRRGRSKCFYVPKAAKLKAEQHKLLQQRRAKMRKLSSDLQLLSKKKLKGLGSLPSGKQAVETFQEN